MTERLFQKMISEKKRDATMRTVGESNIALISYPYSSINMRQVRLQTKLIELLEPPSNELFVITGKFPDSPNKKIHIVTVKGDKIETTDDAKGQSMLTRIITNLLIQLRIIPQLLKISKNINIVVFYGGFQSFLLPMLLSKLLRKKIIALSYRYDSNPKITENIRSEKLFSTREIVSSYIMGFLSNIFYFLADQIVVESEHFINFGGLDRYKNKIYTYGALYLDTDLFAMKRDLKDRGNLVGYIGRFSKEKGVVNFAEAMPLISKLRPNTEFLIGGDGPLRAEVEKDIKDAKLGDRVVLTGWITQDKLPDYLNDLRLLVLSSYVEGLPVIVREAMACGTVVLATPVGGVPDLIKDGETGFIMEDNSPECIAENVIRALEHPNLDKIVRNARKLMEAEYSYEAALERYRKILENM